MHSHLTHSQVPRAVAIESTNDDMHHGRGVIEMPTHDDISKRAYEIYVLSGCKEGQCRQNWHQAESELWAVDLRV